jgi:hypothetical protein
VRIDLREHQLELGARESPLERAGDLPVAAAEGEQALGELVQGAEVIRGKRLALDDREVELDLVEPRGVDGEVDQAQVLVGALEPLDRRPPRV